MLWILFGVLCLLAIGFAGYAASGPTAFLVRVARGRREEIPEIFD